MTSLNGPYTRPGMSEATGLEIERLTTYKAFEDRVNRTNRKTCSAHLRRTLALTKKNLRYYGSEPSPHFRMSFSGWNVERTNAASVELGKLGVSPDAITFHTEEKQDMKTVTIEVRPVGESFGCCAVLLDASTGRKLAETEEVRPYRFREAAYRDGERLAAERGWDVVSAPEATL